jgi:hypothetical protein
MTSRRAILIAIPMIAVGVLTHGELRQTTRMAPRLPLNTKHQANKNNWSWIGNELVIAVLMTFTQLLSLINCFSDTTEQPHSDVEATIHHDDY